MTRARRPARKKAAARPRKPARARAAARRRPAAPAAGLTRAEYARRRGVSRMAVTKAVRTGRIPIGPDGRIDPAAADAAWAANTDPGKPSSTGTAAPGGMPEGGAGQEPGAIEDPITSPVPYLTARAAHEYQKARLAKLEFDERSGRLVDVDEIRDIAFRVARAARDLVLAAADRMAPVVTGMTDLTEVHRLLREEMLRACDELAKVEPEPAVEEPAEASA